MGTVLVRNGYILYILDIRPEYFQTRMQWMNEYVTPKNSDQSSNFFGTGPDADLCCPRSLLHSCGNKRYICFIQALFEKKIVAIWYTRLFANWHWKADGNYIVFKDKKIRIKKENQRWTAHICCGVQYREGCGQDRDETGDSNGSHRGYVIPRLK